MRRSNNIIDFGDVGTAITPYMWSQIEPSAGIICACLTTYRPLFKGLSLRSITSFTWLSSRSRASAGDRATFMSGDLSHIHFEPPKSEHWSTFDFAVDDEKPERSPNNIQELRYFQESSSKATNGGLRMIDGPNPISMNQDNQSEEGSWLESPRSVSEAPSEGKSRQL